MSNDSRAPEGDELSHAIREKVAEANKLQRQLSEAAIHARQVLESLRPTLDEIAAFMHRETGLDVIASHSPPSYLTEPLADSPTGRVAVDLREVTVPTEPPTNLIGGFQVHASLDGSLKILAFWSTGDCKHNVGTHCWSEPFDGNFGTPDQGSTVRRAAEALYSQRHKAAKFLLDTLSGS
jgi:hypothetical protein